MYAGVCLYSGLKPQPLILSHVGTEPHVPGFNEFSGELMALLKDTTRAHEWGSNPVPLDSEYDARPRRYRAPHNTGMSEW